MTLLATFGSACSPADLHATDDLVDRRVGQLGHEAGLVVVKLAGWRRCIGARLQLVIGDRPDTVRRRLTECPERREQLLALLEVTGITDAQRQEALAPRGHEHDDIDREFVRRIFGKVRVEAQDFACLRNRVHERAAIDLRAEPVQLILEGRHDTEISTAAANAPVQIRILVSARTAKPAVRGNDIDGEYIVARQTEAACQASVPATERETARARM